MDQHEIADARRHAKADLRQFVRHPGQPGLVEGDGLLDMVAVADRGGTGGDRHRVDIERSAHAVNGVDDAGRGVHPADAKPGKAVNLGEGARHHDVLRRRDEFDAGLVVVAADIFGIGRVDDQHDMGRQAGMKPPHLLERQVGAGRIVRIGEEDNLRALGDGGEDRVDIGALVRLLDDDRHAACREDLDAVDEEAVLGEDALVAGGQIGLREEAEQFVRAIRAQDVLGVEAMNLGNGPAQLVGRTVRVELGMGEHLRGGVDRLRRGAERRFVG